MVCIYTIYILYNIILNIYLEIFISIICAVMVIENDTHLFTAATCPKNHMKDHYIHNANEFGEQRK